MFNVGGGELLVISQGFQTEIRQAMDFDDKPPAAGPATPTAPRLVDPPAPPGAPNPIETTATDATPPTTQSPNTGAPEANGDEPASGSSAA